MNKSLLFFGALIMLLAGGMVLWYASKFYSQSAAVMETVWNVEDEDYPGKSEKWITDFELTERSGKPFVSKDSMPGTVWVSSVFFASCPTSCKQQNAIMQELAKQYEGKNVRFMSITCDPVNDTPERLRQYASEFQADPEQWLFLTGNMYYIARVSTERFHIGTMYDPQAGPTHMDQFTVTDKFGNIRDGKGGQGGFNWKDEVRLTEMKLLIDQLLEESEPPAESNQPPQVAGMDEVDDEPVDESDGPEQTDAASITDQTEDAETSESTVSPTNETPTSD